MEGRRVSESAAEYSELALPNDANIIGNLLGGKIMHLVDLAAAIAGTKHARNVCVTASVDHMEFLHPVKIGQWVRLRASVNRAFRTSMEVGVKVWVENMSTGLVRHTSSAYLTFVALDSKNNRIPIPPVIPETAVEKRRFEEAGGRREYRLAMKARTSKP